MTEIIHNGHIYKANTTVQHFANGGWWSCELKFDGWFGWYVEWDDPKHKPGTDGNLIRPNNLFLTKKEKTWNT